MLRLDMFIPFWSLYAASDTAVQPVDWDRMEKDAFFFAFPIEEKYKDDWKLVNEKIRKVLRWAFGEMGYPPVRYFVGEHQGWSTSFG